MSTFCGDSLRAVGPMAFAAVLLGSVFGAQAQNVSNGLALYNQSFGGNSSCADCHGSNPASNINKIRKGVSASTNRTAVNNNTGGMGFFASYLTDSNYNDLAAYIASASGLTASYISVVTASLDKTSIPFGSVTVGQTSSAQVVTLLNTGTSALTISSIAKTGASFTSTNTCGSSLAAGGTCAISSTFTPTTTGAASGTITITSNATNSPQTITLSGTGSSTAVANFGWSGSASSLNFSTTVGTPSAAQTLTIVNNGTVSGNISAVTVSGSNPSDFVTGGSCGTGVILAAGASCTVTVAFDPSAAGSRSASLQVSTNASNPAAISLTGTATGATSSATSNSNVGGGGCSVAAAGSPFDPLLLTLGALAALGLAWRRWREG